MTCQTFKTLQPPWQSGSKQILIGGFQKCKKVLVPQGAAKLQAIKVLVLKQTKVFIGGAVFI